MTPSDREVITRLITAIRHADQRIQADILNIQAMRLYSENNPALTENANELIAQDQADIDALMLYVLSEARLATARLTHCSTVGTIDLIGGDNQ